MNSLWLDVLLLGCFTVRSETLQKRRNSSHLDTQQARGQKRAGNFGVVSAAFTSFNKIADFKERCNTVERWFGSIDRFMASGGVQGESEVTSQLLDSIKTDIAAGDLVSNVEAGFKDILAGKEYSETLASLISHMDIFRNLHNVQKEYLEATKRYKETAVGSRNKKSMQETGQKWFDLVGKKLVALKNALIILHENICDPILNSYDLFEGYAWKKGQQHGTGTQVDLMNFITNIRMLEANAYGVWKSHILKKYENDEERQKMEINNVQMKIDNVAKRENPAIARAFTRITDYQGTPAFGRIRWTHAFENTIGYDILGNPIKKKSDRCLTNMGGLQAVPYARECSDDLNQQWKLFSDNTLRPKNDINRCLYLMESGEGNFSPSDDFKLLSCSSRNGNKQFVFEYLTQQEASEPKMFTYFKLKVKNNGVGRDGCRGRNIYLVYRGIEAGWEGGGQEFEDLSPSLLSCPCPGGSAGQDVHNCLGNDFIPDPKPGWFKFEPVSE